MPREDGYFKPGQSGNSAGKKKGTKHKITSKTRNLIDTVINNIVDNYLEKDLAKISSAQRVTAFLKLLEFKYAKIKEVKKETKEKHTYTLRKEIVVKEESKKLNDSTIIIDKEYLKDVKLERE